MDKQIFYSQLDGIRIDLFLTQALSTTRNQIESLIRHNLVKIDGMLVKKCGQKIKQGQKVEVDFLEKLDCDPIDVDFDIEIIYEDEDILILNKPPNLVIHDAPSVKEATLVDWLKSKNIELSTIAGEIRHGIVHRLDKETSGAIAIAKTNHAHISLSEQLKDKSMVRYYLAIIDFPLKESIIIDKPLDRNPKNRLKRSVIKNGKESKSAFLKLMTNSFNEELIAAKLFSGRTHQIRAHLESINRHILGDHLYGFKGDTHKISRIFLHSYILYLKHPINGEHLLFVAKIHDDMSKYLKLRFNLEDENEIFNADNICNAFSTFF
mgnify:CR=1 FL=1